MPSWNLDKKIICSHCGKRPAAYKRNSLCKHCYGRSWRRATDHYVSEGKRCESIEKKYQYKAEMIFGQSHPTFLYQPAFFYIDDTKYSPDFYDPLYNEFYEVIGSRQRFEQLKDKLKRFKELFPHIKLMVCSPDGNSYHSYKNQDLVSDLMEPVELQI